MIRSFRSFVIIFTWWICELNIGNFIFFVDFTWDKFTYRNITAVADQDVVLPCVTKNSSPAQWWFLRSEQEWKYVYRGNGVTGEYKDKINDDLVNLTVGNYSLIIQRVTANDSGKYVCAQDDDRGHWHIIELIVIG